MPATGITEATLRGVITAYMQARDLDPAEFEWMDEYVHEMTKSIMAEAYTQDADPVRLATEFIDGPLARRVAAHRIADDLGSVAGTWFVELHDDHENARFLPFLIESVRKHTAHDAHIYSILGTLGLILRQKGDEDE